MEQIKSEKEKSKGDYQIVTTKLDIDESDIVPKRQDHISFSQKESHHEHKRYDPNQEPTVMK